MSRLVKICRACKTENPGNARGFCAHCGQPLAGVEPEEIDDISAGQVLDSASSEGLAKCPSCGGMTRPFTMCDHCNAELPEASSATSASPPIEGTKLEMIMGTQNFECRNGDVLGRSGTLASNVFKGIDTVSNRHVLVTQEAGKWKVTVFVGVQNTTQLDGEELRRGVSYPLSGEHRLRMSHACEVTLRVSAR